VPEVGLVPPARAAVEQRVLAGLQSSGWRSGSSISIEGSLLRVADCGSDHCGGCSESPVGVLVSVLASSIKLVQLVQQNSGVKLAIVEVAESLHCLVYGVLVFIMKQVGNFSGPVHSLDGNLDRF
jgi:hypothetical protein